jgi:hypothetical protein
MNDAPCRDAQQKMREKYSAYSVAAETLTILEGSSTATKADVSKQRATRTGALKELIEASTAFLACLEEHPEVYGA